MSIVMKMSLFIFMTQRKHENDPVKPVLHIVSAITSKSPKIEGCASAPLRTGPDALRSTRTLKHPDS